MSTAHVALGAVFLALGSVFLGQAKKEGDGVKARNARFAGIMMLLAGILFLIAAGISMATD